MGKCKHHPQNLSPGGSGLCSSCLQKKLNSVWRGESTRSDDVANHPDSSFHQREAIAVVGSIASITKRKHSSKRTKGRDITEAAMDFLPDSRYTDGITSFRPPVQHPSDITQSNLDRKDWTKRRSKVSTLVSKKALADAKSGVTLNALSGARSVGCRSLPLVDRIAKETALRVIKEVGDDMSEGDGVVLEALVKEQDPRITCFSPSRWRSKWGIKGLGSPMTSSNKIFPSKSVDNVQRSLQAHLSPLREDSRFVCAGDVDRQRRTLQGASEVKPSLEVKGFKHGSQFSDSIVIEGMPDRILKPEDMNQRLRTSYNIVLQWLQDLPIPETPLQSIGDGEDPLLSSSFVTGIRGNGAHVEDLAKVGHLHEIAEELEHLDESSVEDQVQTGNHLRDVSSFGKFLIRAAQRKPKQGLSRVASAR